MADLSGFRGAFEGKDLDSLMSYFATDAVIHSPFTTEPIKGKEAVRMVLGIILETLHDVEYIDQLGGADGSAALVVKAKVLESDIEVIDLIRFDSLDLIDDFTVFVRPRPAGEVLFGQVVSRISKGLAAAEA